jgi:hypothetical protein
MDTVAALPAQRKSRRQRVVNEVMRGWSVVAMLLCASCFGSTPMLASVDAAGDLAAPDLLYADCVPNCGFGAGGLCECLASCGGHQLYVNCGGTICYCENGQSFAEETACTKDTALTLMLSCP